MRRGRREGELDCYLCEHEGVTGISPAAIWLAMIHGMPALEPMGR